nr:hypothetical protein [Allomuricauda sp.]
MELKPQIGIDNIKFGMSQNEVIEILGDPDRIILDQDEKEQLILEFFKMKLHLVFYLNGGAKLGSIRTSNPNVIFNGKRIIGTQVGFAKKVIFLDTTEDWEIVVHEFSVAHNNGEFSLILNEEYGTVTHIELGTIFDMRHNWQVWLNTQTIDWLSYLCDPALRILRLFSV